MSVSRREFLASSAAALAAGSAVAAEEEGVAFCVIGDTHFLADAERTGELTADSARTNRGLIDTLNALPGGEVAAAAGGGKVRTLRGVIHAGDVIDSGDKASGTFGARQETEWNGFVREFGLTGGDGRLKTPVYEVHGNHDSPQGAGLVLDGIRERNKTRPGVKARSADGLHYSWDWGPAHFINLGIVVGSSGVTKRKRRYNPLDSLDFLIADLKEHRDRPIVITHHVDMARYTGACDPAGEPTSKEWDPCDVRAYYEAIEKHRVAAIFYGHTHARNVFRWDGAGTKGERGIPVFNVDNSAHFASDSQAFFYVELSPERVLVRELATKNRWAESSWTPQAWSATF